MKTLNLQQRLKMIFEGTYAKKHGNTIENVAKSYGLARPTYYVYRREVVEKLKSIDMTLEEFYDFIIKNGQSGYEIIIDRLTNKRNNESKMEGQQIKDQERKEDQKQEEVQKEPLEQEIKKEKKIVKSKPQNNDIIKEIRSQLNTKVPIQPRARETSQQNPNTANSHSPMSVQDQPRPFHVNWLWLLIIAGAGLFVFFLLKYRKKENKSPEKESQKIQYEPEKEEKPKTITEKYGLPSFF